MALIDITKTMILNSLSDLSIEPQRFPAIIQINTDDTASRPASFSTLSTASLHLVRIGPRLAVFEEYLLISTRLFSPGWTWLTCGQ